MKKDEYFSEEQLNAFVDGELDPEERSQLYNESAQLADLDLRLCQLRKAKELVRYGYEDVPQPSRGARTKIGRRGYFSTALVATFLLVFGLSVGFLARNYMVEGQADKYFDTAAHPAATTSNYLLHVASGEPAQMLAALQEARHLLESAPAGELRQVEVVANERGLDLLRADVTPFATEITALQSSNVVFYACSRTMERLEEKGVEVQLVPNTNSAHTALDRVVTRMKDDWEYIKI